MITERCQPLGQLNDLQFFQEDRLIMLCMYIHNIIYITLICGGFYYAFDPHIHTDTHTKKKVIFLNYFLLFSEDDTYPENDNTRYPCQNIIEKGFDSSSRCID